MLLALVFHSYFLQSLLVCYICLAPIFLTMYCHEFKSCFFFFFFPPRTYLPIHDAFKTKHEIHLQPYGIPLIAQICTADNDKTNEQTKTPTKKHQPKK